MKKIATLISRKEIEVRFNELDPLNVVWHGNYVKYFEDGRESFGLKYGIPYPVLREQGIAAPVVSLNCNFKKSVKYGDKLIVETRYVDNPAAKIVLEYTIFKAENMEVVAEGSTIQVFTDIEGNLQLILPKFIEDWKRKLGLID
ncbi:MAG: acyl-CoA thioesterase [Bacteroidales bacterium]|nr:acyl-CoA thioesterase [Bacteroidales bacterium]